MPVQVREEHPDDYEVTTSGGDTYAVKLGLVAAPEIPEKIARELASELPGLLGKQVDGLVSWKVSVVVDPLTGADRKAPDFLDVCRDRRLEEGWDLAVCLTDLPVYRSERLVVADASAGSRWFRCRSLGCRSSARGRERPPFNSSRNSTRGYRNWGGTLLPPGPMRAAPKQMLRSLPSQRPEVRDLASWSHRGSPSS